MRRNSSLLAAIALLAVAVGAVVAWCLESKRSIAPGGRAGISVASGRAPSARSESGAPASQVVVGPSSIANHDLPPRWPRGATASVSEALAYAATMPEGTDRSDYVQAVLRFCFERNPNRAAELARNLNDPVLRDLGTTFVLELWGQRDGVAALDWAVAHARGDDDPTWFDAAFEGFAAKNPELALAFVLRPEVRDDLETLAHVVVYRFNEQGRLADLRAVVERSSDVVTRDAITKQIIQIWMRADAEAASAWLTNVGSANVVREGMAAIVQAIRLAPDAAADAAEVEHADQLIARVADKWASRDPIGAAAWLRTQSPRAAFDGVMARMAEFAAQNDPVEARSWLSMITDERRRGEVAQRLGI